MKPTFGLGNPNDAFTQYFVGKSYLNPLVDMNKVKLGVFNVTFEPGCHFYNVNYKTFMI